MENDEKYSGLIILIVIVALGYYFFNGRNQWSLFIYPEGDLAADSINTLDAYDTFEECRAGFTNFSKVTFPRGSFECGYKCKVQDTSLGLYMCKETRD